MAFDVVYEPEVSIARERWEEKKSPMGRDIRKWMWLILCTWVLAFLLLPGGKAAEVQAASRYRNQLVWNSAHTERYYYNSSGQQVKSTWVKVGKYKYYVDRYGHVVRNNWLKAGGNYYYANKNGAVYEKCQVRINGKYYYFDAGGAMHKGWLAYGKRWYFYNRSSGARMHSWQKIDGRKYYFYRNGRMAKGWVRSVNGNYYYFEETTNSRFKLGQMHTSWLTYGGKKYYLRPSTGIMLKSGTYTIGGKKYTFDSSGALNGNGTSSSPVVTSSPSPKPTSAKTLKNLMLNALQPVGECLYVWGGGHAYKDATRKGVSPAWRSFYNSQPSTYKFSKGADTSKGLDCSGYIGWSVYNVLNTSSGGTYLGGISNELGPSYASKGWGSLLTLSTLSKNGYKYRCGDIGGDAIHVWMILGQCPDKSAVVLHSTNDAGVRIAGTPKPDGSYGQASQLAQKYMSKYPGTKKFQYNLTTSNYLRRGTYFRWNLTKGPLSDPDGYRNMTAEAILKDLFRY